jgi:hypothetical protein
MGTPSEFAKQTGWRSLLECERYLNLGKNTLSRMAHRDPTKFRALVRGAWLEYNEGVKNEKVK